MAATKSNNGVRKQGYWQGKVDTILEELRGDLKEIKADQKTYITDNTTQHEAIKVSINTLRLKAAKWGGVAGLAGTVAGFIVMLILYHIFGIKM